VNTSTSVKVQYAYVDGSANTIRPTTVKYPNGRVLNYDYGSSGGMDDALSRIASLIDNDGTTHLADYTRLGLNAFVQQDSAQPQITWSLINGAGADPYAGLDRFNRVVDNRWYSTATSSSSSSGSSLSGSSSTDLDRIQHGYDRAGNRLWRRNTVAEVAGAYLDELYSYDGLYRLGELQRGELNGSQNGIVSGTLDFVQAWGLDAIGNWKTFLEDDTGSGSWSLNQARTANQVNEITGITGGSWAIPAYDAAGNMTTMPQPAAPTSSYTAVYDAWNRLISLTDGSTTVGQYAYDGANRRTTKLVSGTTRHFYYSAAWQVLEERLGTSSTADRQFVWGLRYIDDLVLRDRGTERLYGLQDPNWNLTAISDSYGTIQERYAYGAYGMATILTGSFGSRSSSSYDWETRYASYRWDSESILQCIRNRQYHPSMGVWATRDPIGYRGGINLYGYVKNSPLVHRDPFGLDAKCEISCAAQFAICLIVAGESGIGALACLALYGNCLNDCLPPTPPPPAPHPKPVPLPGPFGGARKLTETISKLCLPCKGKSISLPFPTAKITCTGTCNLELNADGSVTGYVTPKSVAAKRTKCPKDTTPPTKDQMLLSCYATLLEKCDLIAKKAEEARANGDDIPGTPIPK
jgi:RHS repeat-associated protein